MSTSRRGRTTRLCGYVVRQRIRKRIEEAFDWIKTVAERIIEESLMPGAMVSAIARTYGVAASQIYGWRRKAIASGAVRRRDELASPSWSGHGAPAADHVEISISGVVLRVGGNVGEAQLRRVIRAVRSA